MIDNDALSDDNDEIAALEKEQRSDKTSIGGEPKTTVEPEPKAEPVQAKTEPQGDPEDPPDEDTILDPNKGKFVRQGALHAERARRKAAEDRERQAQAQFAQTSAQMQERLMALMRAAQPQQQAAPQAQQLPSKDTDPVGYLEALATKNATDLQQIQQWRQAQEQQSQQTGTLSRIQQEVARLESQFEATTPDYKHAQKHLENSWIAEAKAAGFQDHQMPQVIAARTMEIIQAAAQTNGNPAAIAYQVSKTRGYAGPQQPQNNLDTVAKGLAVSKSPTTAAGQSPSGTPALDLLVNMSDTEFALQDWDKIKRMMMNGNASGAAY